MGTILAASKVSQKKSENPSKFGSAVAREIKKTLDLGVPVDQWMQDQLNIYMTLAKGCSRLLTGPLTFHTRTAISIAEQLTSAQFKVTTVEENKRYVIECQGIGLTLNDQKRSFTKAFLVLFAMIFVYAIVSCSIFD